MLLPERLHGAGRVERQVEADRRDVEGAVAQIAHRLPHRLVEETRRRGADLAAAGIDEAYKQRLVAEIADSHPASVGVGERVIVELSVDGRLALRERIVVIERGRLRAGRKEHGRCDCAQHVDDETRRLRRAAVFSAGGSHRRSPP